MIAPIRVEAADLRNGVITVTNLYDFQDLAHVVMTWKVEKDGRTTEQGEMNEVNAAPHQAQTVTIPYKLPESSASRYFLTVSFKLRRDTEWAAAGHEITFEQFELPIVVEKLPRIETNARIELQQQDHSLIVEGFDFCHVLICMTVPSRG